MTKGMKGITCDLNIEGKRVKQVTLSWELAYNIIMCAVTTLIGESGKLGSRLRRLKSPLKNGEAWMKSRYRMMKLYDYVFLVVLYGCEA